MYTLSFVKIADGSLHGLVELTWNGSQGKFVSGLAYEILVFFSPLNFLYEGNSPVSHANTSIIENHPNTVFLNITLSFSSKIPYCPDSTT